MQSAELVNYACYGSMTKEVAEALLDRHIHYAPARIPAHGIRMLTPELMSYAERVVMQGNPRFIAVPDRRYRRGIGGGIIFGLTREEAAILEAFDNSSDGEYEVKVHEIIAIQGLQGEYETKLPAILVARRKLWGKNYGEWRHPRSYNPYEPFGVRGLNQALDTAREFRTHYIENNSY